MPWTFPLLRALLGPRPVTQEKPSLPPVFTDFKIGRPPEPSAGGHYLWSEGVVYLTRYTHNIAWYEAYNHETLHGILHRLEGVETCIALDTLLERNTKNSVREENKKIKALDEDLFIGDAREWLRLSDQEWLPSPKLSPEETKQREQRARFFSGVDVSRPDKKETQS